MVLVEMEKLLDKVLHVHYFLKKVLSKLLIETFLTNNVCSFFIKICTKFYN